jgi:hypothetical protein
VLDEARPSLQALIKVLEAMPREQLIAYARHYDEAMWEVCDTWDGPEVDGITFSEDDTEDLNLWVVSKGQTVWERAVASDDLSELIREYWEEEHTTWDSSVENPRYRGHQSCRGIATVIFEHVHGGDLADELEKD